MNKAELIGYHIVDVTINNHLQPNTKIQIQNSYSYQAKFAPNGVCNGELTITVKDKENEKDFFISVKMIGTFRCDITCEREELHALTFKQLFPYVRAYISALTACGGLPPIMVPSPDIDNKPVYRVDYRPEGQ